ncbi:hypothetical protein ACE1ET_07560 [Saccharicrinis sp. FJH62]|uniref:hypothetical protein n=1 Tax=Saccharicrinis sp. FJH62 TaxID=3344657 RepID=UPI0035D4B59E
MENDQTKYYYKCENCGYLTEIKHTNHIWCYNCTEQFSNYFKKWHQNNNKDLESYQKEICHGFNKSELLNNVEQYNKKVEIQTPTKEQIMRRTYIKQGISVEAAYRNHWDFDRIKYYVLGLVAIAIVAMIIKILAS